MLKDLKQILNILIVAYLACGIWGWNTLAIPRSSASDDKVTSRAGVGQDVKKISFEVTMMAEARDEDGIHFGVTSYKASDGVGLTLRHNKFDSPSAANEYLRKSITKATKIIERGGKKDGSGKIVGERAVAVFPTATREESIHAILLTFGPDFYEIKSSSSRDNLELERYLTN